MKQEIHLEEGKYTVVLDTDPDFKFYALRYNEKYLDKDLVGDNLMLSAFKEIVKLKEEIQTFHAINETPHIKIEKAGDKEFHVAYWKCKAMLSGANVNATDMGQAIQRVCERLNIDPCCVVYAHAKDSIYPKI